ncbi:MAG TPA: hypothetical protein VEC01_17745 [Noviherbaspirillum sp.]|uniref:hypothetical protein n=1 Tax=Noviherbaspirillum sp. TaxID=1926288 RepID=UPI002D5FC9D1|nr:hypothetical protein [Noviherbaspirillum sp.]HYD97174.1 hypothetical protein [Noviherbaspirillum sp.]
MLRSIDAGAGLLLIAAAAMTRTFPFGRTCGLAASTGKGPASTWVTPFASGGTGTAGASCSAVSRERGPTPGFVPLSGKAGGARRDRFLVMTTVGGGAESEGREGAMPAPVLSTVCAWQPTASAVWLPSGSAAGGSSKRVRRFTTETVGRAVSGSAGRSGTLLFVSRATGLASVCLAGRADKVKVFEILVIGKASDQLY